MQDEAYGTVAQIGLLRRGQAMFEVLGGDPRFDYYGRTVGVVSPADAPLSTVFRLAQLQGASHFYSISLEETDDCVAQAQAAGFSANVYRHWKGSERPLEAARSIAAQTSLPGGLELVWIDQDTSTETLEALADATGSVGVMLLAGNVLRGISRNSAICVAQDATGRVVSCAASCQNIEIGHSMHGGEFWWGMLTTRTEARGARLSMALGARALLAAHERYGAERFFTGVQPGNAPSEAVCARMGFSKAPCNVISMVDAAALPGGKLTR